MGILFTIHPVRTAFSRAGIHHSRFNNIITLKFSGETLVN
jgi:hypothetical protein